MIIKRDLKIGKRALYIWKHVDVKFWISDM